MEPPVLLWVDLSESGSSLALAVASEGPSAIHRIRRVAELDAKVHAVRPLCLCFEYDYPDGVELAALTEAKARHPAVPIIMVTTYHSAALAVWALRTRVWDYIVKPCSAVDVLGRVSVLLQITWPDQERRSPRQALIPSDEVNNSPVPLQSCRITKAILKAQAYVEHHLNEKINQTDVASHCGLSRSHFSRVFKQVTGLGFSEYVLRERIARAVLLLQRPAITVTEVCYEVGFQDPGYFGRQFRSRIGVSPSLYRDSLHSDFHPDTL